MKISQDELIGVLSQFNPWWKGQAIPDLPEWKRASFNELYTWVCDPPTPRAVLLSGARQVGKTTLLRQVINVLLTERGVKPANILYATFDHPLIKMAGVDAILEAWRERMPKLEGEEYIFLDEAQFVRDFGTWVKHQVDFSKYRRITFTGSAMPLIQEESGVGRWHTIKLTTLSFYEYLQLKKTSELKEHRKHSDLIKSIIDDNPRRAGEYKSILETFSLSPILSLPDLPPLNSLHDLFTWPQDKFYQIADIAELYAGYFNQYLVRGGFPQTALVHSINQAHQLLREDIIDKVLKRDMTVLFGVRRVLELEQTFLYLCMHDGGLLDMQQLCGNLAIKRPTAQNFITLLEDIHLIYRLEPYGYGKEILRAKFKIYLADPAIASAVLLKGSGILDNSRDLGVATETAVFKHLYARHYPQNIRFTYWRGTKEHEVDLIAETNDQKIPFEIKYRAKKTGGRDLKGLIEFCNKEETKYGYIITKSLKDFGLLKDHSFKDTKIMKIPAALFCYWMGEAELSQTNL